MTPHNSNRILILEDDAAMQLLLQEFLQMQGFESSAFRAASKALEFIESLPVDQLAQVQLVISDINVPQMDGFEFMGRVRASLPGVPVIFITAFGSEETEQKAQDNGAFAYLNKPFKLKELKSAVHAALQKNSA